MGAEKTLLVAGAFSGVLIIEASVDGGSTFAPIAVVNGAGRRAIQAAVQFMRVRSRGAIGAPFSPRVDVGGSDAGCQFVTVPAPPRNAMGASVAIPNHGTVSTIIVGGSFGGAITLEVSDDDSRWTSLKTMTRPGDHTVRVSANYIRARSSGSAATSAHAPTVAYGSENEDARSEVFVPRGSGEIIIYARAAGSDTTGDGSQTSPYATIARAMQDVPREYDGTRYIVDCTGVTEQMAAQYVLPMMCAPGQSRLLVSLSSEFNQWEAPFVLRADPTILESFTPSGETADAVTGLRTLENSGAGWTPDEHRGRLVIGSGFFQLGVCVSNTTDELFVSSRSSFTGPVRIAEPSATIELTDAGNSDAAVYLQALTDVVISGIAFKHANTASFAASLWVAGAQQVVCNLCTFEGVYAETELLADGCYFGDRGGSTKEVYNAGAELRGRFCYFRNQELRQYGAGATGNSGPFGCVFDDCTSLGHGGNNEPEAAWEINFCEVRNAKAGGVLFLGGGRSSVRDTVINGSATAAVACAGPGLLQLNNVQGSGNGTWGCAISTGGHVETLGGTAVTGASGDVSLGGAGATPWGSAPANDLGAATPQGCFLHG